MAERVLSPHELNRALLARQLLLDRTKTPQSVSAFLVDGHVAGTWKSERGNVVLDPFERFPAAVRRELEGEAERLAGFLG